MLSRIPVNTLLYIAGIFFAGAVVGGACGSLVGGWTLTSYTNISERYLVTLSAKITQFYCDLAIPSEYPLPNFFAFTILSIFDLK